MLKFLLLMLQWFAEQYQGDSLKRMKWKLDRNVYIHHA